MQVRRQPVFAVVLMLVLAGSLFAANDKEQVYNAPFDKVWAATVKAANEKFTLIHSEKESGVLSFETGTSTTSYGFTVGVSVTKLADDKTKVTVNAQKKRAQVAWGAGDRIAKKFFDAVEENLKSNPAGSGE
jgi:hypothetical protein